MKPFVKEIAIDRQFESGTRSETHQVGVVGGVVHGIRLDASPGGSQTRLRVVWEENSLVFESGTYTGQSAETGVWAERREVWSLDRDGRLRVEIATGRSADDSRAITLIYRRP